MLLKGKSLLTGCLISPLPYLALHTDTNSPALEDRQVAFYLLTLNVIPPRMPQSRISQSSRKYVDLFREIMMFVETVPNC